MPSLARIIQIGKILSAAYTPNADGSYTLPDGYSVMYVIYGDDLATVRKFDCKIPCKTVQYGFICRKDADFVVCLRGTTTAWEWMLDAEFWKRSSPFGVGGVEDGFGDAFDSLRIDDETTLPEAIAELLASVAGATLTVTGHSLGGPLATLTARAIANLNPTCITFASPYCGDSAFAAEFNLKVPDSVRIVNDADLVPTLPKPIPLIGLDYTHVAGLMMVNGGSKHIPSCRHSLATYLHGLDASMAMDAECV